MVTKGIVEEIIDKYNIKVRCPLYDKVKDSSLTNNDLNVSSICSILGVDLNLSIGDIVFVEFEDNNLLNPTIVGCLSIDSNSYSNINTNSLNIDNSLKLPKDTKIGDIDSFELSNLSGLKSNLNKQLDELYKKIDDNNDLLDNCINEISNQKNDMDNYYDMLNLCYEINKNFIDLIGNKSDVNNTTIYGRINLYNKKIEDLNKLLGIVNSDIIISDKIKKINKLYNDLSLGITDTTPNLNTNFDIMLSRAEKMINVSWSPKHSLKQWNSDKLFEANKTYYGMPYSLFNYGYTYEIWKKHASDNITSNGSVYGYGYREGPKYGSCCADFISEILGLPEHTRSCIGLLNNSKYLEKLDNNNSKYSNIKVGDVLVSSNSSHVIWIGKIYNDEVVIYEQTPPLAKKSKITISSNIDTNGYLKYGGLSYTVILRPTQELLDINLNNIEDNSVNITNDWVYKGTKTYGKFSEQRLTETEYMNNALVFWKLVKKAGWTAEAAAGAWANAFAESTGNPWSYGTGGGGLFGFTPFDYGNKYSTAIYDYANNVLKDASKRWDGNTQVNFINWQIKHIIEDGWTGIFQIRNTEKYWNYIPPENTRIPKNDFNLDTYIKLNIKDYDATPTICAKLWLARYGVVKTTYDWRDLDKTISNHTKKAEDLYQLFIKY